MKKVNLNIQNLNIYHCVNPYLIDILQIPEFQYDRAKSNSIYNCMGDIEGKSDKHRDYSVDLEIDPLLKLLKEKCGDYDLDVYPNSKLP